TSALSRAGMTRRSRSSIRTLSCLPSPLSSCTARTALVPRSCSVTTFQKVDADFKAKIGSNTSVSWPVGIAAKGSEGVANNVGQTKGAISYVEYAYVKQNKLAHANMINKDGKTIAPDLKTFQAAAVSANWSSAPGFGIILTNQPGPNSWPITSA